MADIVAACAANWPEHRSDCSGFCRAVAAALSIPLRGLANQIVDTIRSGNGWTVLPDGATAAAQAQAGKFVIAGLKGSEQARPNAHGHVVVVVPGSLAAGKYPHAFWGQLGGVGRQNETINYSWSQSDRDRVTYAAYDAEPVEAEPPPENPDPTAPEPPSTASANEVVTTYSNGRTVRPSNAVTESADAPTTGEFDPAPSPNASGKPLARLGDPLTGGGQIISGSETTSVNDLPVARLGDLVFCKQHGLTTIVALCSPTVSHGDKQAAPMGAIAACGHIVIGGSPNTFID